MRYFKILGLLAVTGAALMAFAGSAWATMLVSPVSGLKADSEGAVILHGTVDVECAASSIEAKIEQSGSGITAKGKITSLTFSECGSHISVLAPGSLEIHALGNGNGTVTWSNARITVLQTTIFGAIHCELGTSNTHIGTLTGSTTTGATATLELVNTAFLPTVEGGPICLEKWWWTGSFKVDPLVSKDQFDIS